MLRFDLPYPPTVNNYYKKWRNRIVISKEGKEYRQKVGALLAPWASKNEPFNEPLSVTVLIYPPDKRKRDTDNVLKCLFDSLTHAGIYEDDYLIERHEVIRQREIIKGGLVSIEIERWQ